MAFQELPTRRWSLKMICENFQDWLLQGCFEREAALRKEDQKVEELRQDAHRMCEHND